MLNKVGFCHNISFWPHLIHFWAISLQNRLKMCAFLRGITWATSCEHNQFKPVQTSPVALFESMQLQLLVWSYISKPTDFSQALI